MNTKLLKPDFVLWLFHPIPNKAKNSTVLFEGWILFQQKSCACGVRMVWAMYSIEECCWDGYRTSPLTYNVTVPRDGYLNKRYVTCMKADETGAMKI